MSNKKIDLLYLNEHDTIQAGVMDMHKCIETMKDVYHLLSCGDYVMGGRNHNSHGTMISFPDDDVFPNMPKNGPDRRFMSMIAYVGGHFNIAGEKWYGSNRANLEKGLPRSILTVMLNDVDTAAPVSILAANLISTVRTGAIPGLAARYLANSDSKECALIGAGVITRSCFIGLADTLNEIDTVRVYDVKKEAAENLAGYICKNYPNIKAIAVDSIEKAVRSADVIHSATSGKQYPYIKTEWLKSGVFCSFPSSIDLDEDFILNGCTRVIDNWKMYEAWSEELEKPYWSVMGLIGTKYLDLIEEGKMTISQITNLGDIITGKCPGRINHEEKIVFGMGGMCIYDVAWAKVIYDNAVTMELGTKLNFWDKR